MMTKLKLALVTSIGLLATVGGIAAANNSDATGTWGGRKAEILAKYDTNGDGVLDANEKAAMKQAFVAKRAERKAEMLAKWDTNKDGKLEPTERAAMKAAFADKKFAKLDTNGDGVVSKAEFEAGAQRMGHHRHGFRGGMLKGQE
jgi:Ca2+-binding EF-hand superfamily protein